ncbi:ATP-binding protein [Vibrio parahaemolyticus]|uniref:AAA family ATPase n=1 Tax=Vibrio harveyi group TaxID=717610 RepID=UPI000CE4D9B3|nr:MULTISPECIES: ATP-binding protein [Vibrio harveyi group]MCE7729261.1 ATP-binding protein [Vibrio campbellii]MCR9653246.1 ATP-binding protein [Vibrio parahaemolyticus]QLK44293.1 ATP-binding protein [Vibrio owensii]
MKQTIVPVKNVLRLVSAGNALMERPMGTPGIGAIYGQSGLGKTTAATWFINKCNGVYVRAKKLWTPLSMMQSICDELGIDRHRSAVACQDAIIEALALENRPLFIDEADYVVESAAMVEAIRDIHDMSTVPVILIGMKNFAKKIKRFPQFDNRIMQWVEFAHCDLDDARNIVNEMSDKVKISDDLLEALVRESKGEVRRVVVGLYQIEQYALNQGKAEMTLKEFKGQFHLGHVGV